MERADGRLPRELRPVTFEVDVNAHAEGSCLMRIGRTAVLATASLEDKVPPFLRGKGQGWVHAEYGMLPRATRERTPREVTRGRPQGRTQEIQRLIARALRAVTRLEVLGERGVVVDVDVLQADGGTRTAGICAGFLALMGAMRRLEPTAPPFVDWLGAVSVGLVGGEVWLDLCYDEDSTVDVDFNCAMTADHRLVEVQGSAERGLFDRAALDLMLDVAASGIDELVGRMRAAFPEGEKYVQRDLGAREP
ncbi:MAG: ribonuclease PH [Actinomycetia bacterium]|nr:ribonuclease PH [Actinomycetes bacterium]